MSPPKGFRKPIPDGVKLRVVILGGAKCTVCGEPLGELANTQFDHVPAIGLRGWDPDARDAIPGSNDVAFIFAKHVDCHALKTHGRKGSSKLSRVGGDISEIAKLRRLTRKQAEYRASILAKDVPPVADPAVDAAVQSAEPKPKPKPKPKPAWPKRSFQKKPPRPAAPDEDR